MKTMTQGTNKGSFLRSDELAWASSNLFFMSLNKLKINDNIYHMPIGYTASNEELKYYVKHLYNQLMTVDTSTDEEKLAHEYCRKISAILSTWAEEGYSLKVV